MWLLISCIFQLHQQALKNQADEKRRTERKQRHLQDDLRYALKKLSAPLDISLSYDAVCDFICLMQTACLFVLCRLCLSSKICRSTKLWKMMKAGVQRLRNLLRGKRFSPIRLLFNPECLS
jgi:hypothetical protein